MSPLHHLLFICVQVNQYDDLNGEYSIPEQALPPVQVKTVLPDSQPTPTVLVDAPAADGAPAVLADSLTPTCSSMEPTDGRDNQELSVSTREEGVNSAKSSKGSSPVSSLDSASSSSSSSSSGVSSVKETSPTSPVTRSVTPALNKDAVEEMEVEPVGMETLTGNDEAVRMGGEESPKVTKEASKDIIVKEEAKDVGMDGVDPLPNDSKEPNDSKDPSMPVKSEEPAKLAEAVPHEESADNKPAEVMLRVESADNKPASVIVYTSKKDEERVKEEEDGSKGAGKTPSQPPAAPVATAGKEGEGKAGGRKKSDSRFMFNIADGGFTELHNLWAEEKTTGFNSKVWSRHHDYWLLKALVSYPHIINKMVC